MQKPILEFFSGTLVQATYRVFIKRTLVVEESIHVTFDESNSLDKEKGSASHDVDSEISFEELTI